MSTTQALGFCGITNHNLLKIRSEPLTLPNRGSILTDAATVRVRDHRQVSENRRGRKRISGKSHIEGLHIQ